MVRILDEKTGREARIGFGFRDRDEATDFRESLNYYVKSLRRDEEAAEAMHHYEDNLGAKLSLQDGEKIHLNLGIKKGEVKKSTITKSSTPATPDGTKKSPILLKKPPPAPKLDKDVSISFGDIDINAIEGDAPDASSTAALGEASSAGDDDIWQDFEDAQDDSEGNK